jgi:hypothetical protein
MELGRPWTLTLEAWSRRGSVDQWSQIRNNLTRSRIWIRIRIKNENRHTDPHESDAEAATLNYTVYSYRYITRGGQANANPQILGLIPLLQILKFLRCASPQIVNPQIKKGLTLVFKRFLLCKFEIEQYMLFL